MGGVAYLAPYIREGAVKLASKRVAVNSGDARRMLNLCKWAVASAMQELVAPGGGRAVGDVLVSMDHLQRAIKAVATDPPPSAGRPRAR